MVNSSGRDDFTYPRRWADPTAAFNGRALENYLREVGWTVVETNLRSANWDGGNALPSDSATSGFFLDAVSGSAQFAGSMYIGGETVLDGDLDVAGTLTITGTGVLQSSESTTAPRYILSASGTYGSIGFSSGHASETDQGYLRVGGPTVPYTWLRSPVITGVDSGLTITGDSVRIESRTGYSATLQGHAGFSLESVTGDIYITSTTATKKVYFGFGATIGTTLSYSGGNGMLATDVATISNEVQVGDGSAADPSITFINDGNTGFYRTSGQLIATVGSAWRWVVTASKFETSSGVTIASGDNGTVSLPGITWSSDTNTGFYRVANNYMAAAAGAVIVQQWGYTGSNKEVYLYGLPSAATNYVRYNGTTGQLSYSSSTLRIKKDIRDIEPGLSDKLRPVWFKYRRDDEIDQPEESSHEHQSSQFRVAEDEWDTEHAGHIAEWTAEADPRLAIYNAEDPVPVNYEVEGLLAIAMADLKDVRRRVLALEQGSNDGDNV